MDDCILFKGAISSGYGHVWNGKKVVTAHRLAYEKTNGVIPIGLEVHHICHKRLCINSKHLVALSKREHMLFHFSERIGFNNSLKTHCKKGHIFDGNNGKQRYCKQCRTAYKTQWARKNYEKRKNHINEWRRKWRHERKKKGLPYI